MHPVQADTKCFHCGEPCADTPVAAGDKTFCCNGCRSVYEILHQNDLDNFYCLNDAPGISQKKHSEKKFDWLNDPAIAAKLLSFSNAEICKVKFYLPQIHCSSCLWLLENLGKINSGFVFSQVNFQNKELFVTYDRQKLTLGEVASILASVGYEPHLSLQDIENGAGKGKTNAAVYKLGIAGFCFANIMLISFPEYFGLNLQNDALLTHFFRWINLGLSLPVVFYCAQEFFANAFYSFKQKYLNIDAPIALAILVTFARSVYEVASGTGAGYFDSLSGIVFFMLAGRAVQNRVHTSLRFNRDFESYFPIAVTVRKNEHDTVKPIRDVQVNDVIVLQNAEVAPVDGILSKGRADLDYSFVTGESLPQPVNVGDLVYAGARVTGGAIELLTTKPFSQAGFTQLWNNPAFSKEESAKGSFVTALGKYFSLVVILIAMGAFAAWYPKSHGLAWNSLTAVLIIACPCALLLTASFTYGFIIERFAEKGFFLKNANAVDSLSKINTVVFDKTGTLTEAQALRAVPQLAHWNAEEKNIALSLAACSAHPYSKSLVASAGRFEKIPIAHFKEIPGAGMEAWINDRHFKIGHGKFVLGEGSVLETEGANLFIGADNRLLAYYRFESALRAGVEGMLRELRPYKTFLLSGDNDLSRPQMEAIFPAGAELVFRKGPEQKLAFIKGLQEKGAVTLMLGDGLNDAGALKQSDAGVAVVDNTFSFTPACNGVLGADKLPLLPGFLRAAKSTRTLILIGLLYSAVYNFIRLYFATSGTMRPVVAAVLMPLSSLGVILISFVGTALIFGRRGQNGG